MDITSNIVACEPRSVCLSCRCLVSMHFCIFIVTTLESLCPKSIERKLDTIGLWTSLLFGSFCGSMESNQSLSHSLSDSLTIHSLNQAVIPCSHAKYHHCSTPRQKRRNMTKYHCIIDILCLYCYVNML